MEKDVIERDVTIGISNLSCVAALQCLGFEVVDEKRSGRVYFFFDRNKKLDGRSVHDVMYDYLNDKLEVKANSFNSKLDYIKSHVFTKQG